jgi:hypothetical protein
MGCVRSVVATRAFWAALVLAGLWASTADAKPRKVSPAAQPTDLGGIWTNASYTGLQRPKAFKSLVISEAEARVYEATLAPTHGVQPFPDDTLGQVASEFNDSGDHLARIHGEIRTSWIIDPADGRVPYTAEAKRRLRFGEPDLYDNPEDLDDSLRCRYANGSAPPQMSSMDTNLVQIVQTKDYVALYSEKNHDVRIISLNVARDPMRPPSWSGDSIGHWQGKTLVVETKNFRDDLVDRFFFAYSKAATIEERFTRISPTEILYAFAVNDVTMFSQPWRGEMLFKAAKSPIYEFACHEGNYSLPSILRAARLGRQVQPPPPAATAPTP